jgi:hypothetical protein
MRTPYLELFRKNPLVLIVSLPSNDPELARIAWEEGADVVKVHINVVHHASQTHYGSFAEERPVLEKIIGTAKGPCGIVAGGDIESARRDYRSCAAAGFEFVSLYAHHAPPELLAFDGLKRMIALDYSYAPEDAGVLRAAGADVLEASVMHPDTYGQPLSVRELLTYRRICRAAKEASEKDGIFPVVIPTQRAIRPEELFSLADAGAGGIMIGAVVTGKTAETFSRAVAAFRKAVDGLNREAPRAVLC